jgi:hypothetical protein
MPAMGYRGKVREQRDARALRRAGLPLAEIAARLGVSKTSVSLWVRDVQFEPIPRVTRGRRREPNALQRRRQAQIDHLVAEGRTRIGRLSEREFLVAGVALYAGEGSKRDGAIRFANSDPRMIVFFCCWLRRFFEIDESRLRVRIYLHQGLNLAAATAYWSALTGIPRHSSVRRTVQSPTRRSVTPSMCTVAPRSVTVAA